MISPDMTKEEATLVASIVMDHNDVGHQLLLERADPQSAMWVASFAATITRK